MIVNDVIRKKAFVTYLGTDGFMYGVITLAASLMEFNPGCELLVLVSENVSGTAIEFLTVKGIKTKIIKEIANPEVPGEDDRGRKCMYTKLRVFDLIEYEKIVYLDADMLVCDNIESLFEKPHMSAVVAGRIKPGNEDYVDFNSGLMVIEPDRRTFEKMLSLIGKLPSDDQADQGFLHSFYSDWNNCENLHLHHRFNLPSICMDDYCRLYDFEFLYDRKTFHRKNVSIIHYWGTTKPWQMPLDPDKAVEAIASKFDQSVLLWWDYFYKAM